MSYQFLDANGSVLTADSSIVSGVIQRPAVDIGSVLSAIPISGNVNLSNSSIIALQGGTQITSVVGNYPAGSALIVSAAGNFNLGARNDVLASILGGNGTFAPMTIGPVGEVITANAPITQWVQGIASCFTGVIQPIIPAQGASVFSYITSLQITNASANNVYLTFFGANSSIVGYLPVPANGGAVPVIPNGWKTNANGAFSASVSGVSSVFLSAQGFISKT